MSSESGGRFPRRVAVLALMLLWSSALAGCGAERRSRLLFYCGAGIRPPAAELAEEFGRRRGVQVECNYSGSELLLGSIKLSGMGDVYMPGDVRYIDQAKQEGLIERSETVCYFIPVILVRKGNPRRIEKLADLLRPDVRLGLGDPKACAIGRTAAKLFAKNGISEEEVDRRVAFRAITVNDLGEKVKLGSLDAVIVWDAIAAYFQGEAEAVPIPREQNVISTVAIGVLRSSQNPELAREFAELVTSEEGKAVFRKHHYSLSLPEPAPASSGGGETDSPR